MRNVTLRSISAPCFLWGSARSGTNLICWTLEQSPLIECYNEDNENAFDNYFLRPNDVLTSLVSRSTRPQIFFKSFSDTPRAAELMGFFDRAKALYAVRNPIDTIASFAQAFGDLVHIWEARFEDAAAGRPGALLRLGASSRERYRLIRSSAQAAVARLQRYGATPHNIAAVYYLWQHSYCIELLHAFHSRLFIIDYDALVGSPKPAVSRIAAWLEIPDISFNLAAWHRGRGPRRETGSASKELVDECQQLYWSIRAVVGVKQIEFATSA
jgi:hypothetical protein